MKKMFLLITLTVISIFSYGVEKNPVNENVENKTSEQSNWIKGIPEDQVYWGKMAEGMSCALIDHFWGTNFDGYKDRYYFNYGNDLSNMSTGNYWPQAHAMDVIVDAYIESVLSRYLSFMVGRDS